MTDAKTTYLLLAQIEDQTLNAIEANIRQRYKYERVSAKTFLIFGDYTPKETLQKIMNEIKQQDGIYLYSLSNPVTPHDL